jgi:hypothetical protein
MSSGWSRMLDSGPTSPNPQEKPSAYSPVTLSYPHREMQMHSLSDSELDTIASSNGSIDLALLGISAGAFITLIITLSTVEISDPKKFAAFVAVAALAGFLSLTFGWRTYSSHKAAQKILNDIKHPPTAPL